jgi:hypothetical protein
VRERKNCRMGCREEERNGGRKRRMDGEKAKGLSQKK